MNTDIRLSVGFWQHPKTKKTAKRLGLEGIRSLQVLWLWAAQNRSDGNLVGMDEEDIELAADWQGEEGAFWKVCEGLWIDRTDDGYALHDWADHNPWQAEAKLRSEQASKAARSKWGSTQKEGALTRSQRLSEARRKCSHTEEEWSAMVKFFGTACVRCGKHIEKPVKDHIIPIYKGGCDGIRNLQPVCTSCNSSKGPEIRDFREEYSAKNGKKMPPGWLLNACEMPADDCPEVCPSPLLTKEEKKEVCVNTRARVDPPSPSKGQTDDPEFLACANGKERPKMLDSPSKGNPEWPAFRSCWDVYPVKQEQEDAWREWIRLKTQGLLPQAWEIRDAILTMASKDSRWKRGMIPIFANWLRKKKWDDEPFLEPDRESAVAIRDGPPSARTQHQKNKQDLEGLAAFVSAADRELNYGNTTEDCYGTCADGHALPASLGCQSRATGNSGGMD